MNLFDRFKVQPTTHRLRLEDIQFRQGDKMAIRLALKDDVTPKESALISVLFAVAVGSASTLTLWDYWGFIETNQLQRHFEKNT